MTDSAAEPSSAHGILFLFQNLPRQTAIVLTGMSLGGATYFWVRSLRG